jgi:GMP synthase-like glutamine amidotransferase
VRILVLEHESDAPACLLDDWAQARGHKLDVVAVPELRRWPMVAGFGAIVTLGSVRSVHASPDPWIAREIEFLAAAHQRAVPILGICFGGQALSKALGGNVGRAPRPELTWREIESADPELITAGPWLLWHEDQFTLPPGARLLAGSESETIAFESGTSIGLQFHPEADAQRAAVWLEGARSRLASRGVDEAALDREIGRHGPGARDRALHLLDRVERRWASAYARPAAAAKARLA